MLDDATSVYLRAYIDVAASARPAFIDAVCMRIWHLHTAAKRVPCVLQGKDFASSTIGILYTGHLCALGRVQLTRFPSHMFRLLSCAEEQNSRARAQSPPRRVSFCALQRNLLSDFQEVGLHVECSCTGSRSARRTTYAVTCWKGSGCPSVCGVPSSAVVAHIHPYLRQRRTQS